MMLTSRERQMIADIRENAAPIGERDTRTPSDLRRQQRRLLEIIDRITGADAMIACQLLVKWHSSVFVTGRALVLDNGYPVDHTDLNEATRLAKGVVGDPWENVLKAAKYLREAGG